ncbi:MAG: GcrA family cell cycle regulator [Gammaproteobacteria bacterium]
MRTRLPRLWAQGLTKTQLSIELECSPHSIIAWAKRLGLPERQGFWTAERDGLLRHLWIKGASATAIGKELGCSKNAVVGRKGRLGLAARKSPIKRHQKPVSHPSLTGSPSEDTAPPEPPQPQEQPIQKPARTCQWPYGEPGAKGFRFCGEPCMRKPEGWWPYCREHVSRAYIFKAGHSWAGRPTRREKREGRFS